MNRFLFLAIIVTLNCGMPTADCFSQSPGIQWQNTIGGSADDKLYSIEQTEDGGCILAGYSLSGISGDKTEALISASKEDFWVIKLDSNGLIEWQNSIGGNQKDYLESIQQTTDKGYILGGYSGSGISGDKTEAAWIGGALGQDYWILKLDSLGNIQWQNDIGGTRDDQLHAIQQTEDGGYIVGGTSYSFLSGDKTEGLVGGFTNDYWILKLDTAGLIQWQNTIGGNSSDELCSIKQTTDNGYIIGGYSESAASGDKSENSIGNTDYWVVKVDSLGVVQWENTIGGSSYDYLRSAEQTMDGGYMLGGYSISSISGDKTEARIGDNDYWIIKLNSSGVIEWQKTIGGDHYDQLRDMHQTAEGGFILGGYSESYISGNKTVNTHGGYDYWMIKLDPAGAIEWQTSYGGTGAEVFLAMDITDDYGYLLAGYSASGISGNKTEASLGSNDYWVIRTEGTCLPFTETCNSLDDNCNGLIDDGVVESISISAGGATTFCQGGNVLLSAVYSGVTLQWKKNGSNIPGATNANYSATKTGTYTCTTTSPCGTATSDGISVTVKSNPPASITAGGATTFCMGGSVVLTANAGGGLAYQWYKGASAIAGATLINYTATLAGNYKCRVTKTATGCFKNSNVITVTVPCKEGEESNNNSITNNSITIFPNPATDKLNIVIGTMNQEPGIKTNSTIVITDMTGKAVSTFEISSSTIQIDISNYAAGMYFINVMIEGKEFTEKFIKE